MKHSVLRAAAASATGLAVISWPLIAHSQDERGASPPPPRDVYMVQEKRPNAGLIASGALMFGIPYASSIVVAAASDRPSDQKLYFPVVGPWMNLADRGTCTEPRCDNETGNKVLLVANGIFQGVGALEIVAGFLFPSTHTVARTVGVHVTPTAGLSSVGVMAYGTF